MSRTALPMVPYGSLKSAAVGYGVAAGTAGAVGLQQLRAVQPLFPAETARETVKTVADTTAEAARR